MPTGRFPLRWARHRFETLCRALGRLDERLDERIRAHVLLCWLALLLIRAERRTSLPQTTRLTDTQTRLFRDCGVPLPPKMSALKTPE
ncbi:hypothetical protein [Streptomyces griseoruber]|uniref:Transposase n=1 Tax=Streptomyces griseoruber TaxID=1943 RepID=A0A101T740_9ACTN|nr:hypothetical protein [Streptomyces griseoruber]KUN87080.1 hypothetical protein AQJ64_07280 [Streptomyces griseoruber]